MNVRSGPNWANDYDFLAELPRLERLALVDCWVTNLSAIRPLSGLREVTVLDCDNIDDITVLVDVPGLVQAVQRSAVRGQGPRYGWAPNAEVAAARTEPSRYLYAYDDIAVIARERMRELPR